MNIDHHLHTRFSPDSNENLDNLAAATRLFGLDGFVVTDHVDMPDWPSDGYAYSPRRAEGYAAVAEARAKHPDLHIGWGVELGNHLYNPERATSILADPHLDFVIGSAHTLADGLDFYLIRYTSEENCRTYLARYSDELLTHCRDSDLDVLGHLTYPLRYMHTAGFRPDLTLYRDAIAACFTALIERGRGIELNTSGWRQPLGVPLPDEYWLKLYRDLGGEIVTVGSDAHTAQDLGSRFTDAYALLAHCGFTHHTIFRHRQPTAHPL